MSLLRLLRYSFTEKVFNSGSGFIRRESFKPPEEVLGLSLYVLTRYRVVVFKNHMIKASSQSGRSFKWTI